MNYAIVLAGGTGSRIGAKVPKQFIEVLGKPMMIYCLEIFEKHKKVDGIVLVCIADYIDLAKKYCEQYGISKILNIIPGGEDFTHSCMNGMDYLRDICGENDNVMVVAADRPFINSQEIDEAIEMTNEHGSGIPVRKCALCMFMVGEDRTHSSDYQRENLVQIQSPWTFRYRGFLDALDKYRRGELPPCENYPVAMYAAAGNEVYFTKGDPRNIKITERTDIALMEQMLKERE
jgi:2-C-methyl-D-erythritol 4-phosphate cytidylyltransferase